MTTEKDHITATSSIEQLPADVSTLQQMVLTLLGQIDDLQGQLYYLKRQLFGHRSEKLDPAQRLLFENLYCSRLKIMALLTFVVAMIEFLGASGGRG